MKRPRCSVRRPLIDQVSERQTMINPNKRIVPPFTAVPNTIEVLERVRDSYKGVPERKALTGADQAVLAAVEMSLKHVARAS